MKERKWEAYSQLFGILKLKSLIIRSRWGGEVGVTKPSSGVIKSRPGAVVDERQEVQRNPIEGFFV